MNGTRETDRLEVELQLQSRAFEGVTSLLRALGTTLEVERVARLSLLTVCGQLLVSRAAFYLLDDEDHLGLCALVGARPAALGEGRIHFGAAMREHLERVGGAAAVQDDWQLSPELRNHFAYAALLHDLEKPVGLLLIGDRVSGRRFDEVETHLLQTMGMVIGATLQRALSYERMRKAKSRMEEAERMRAMILDHVSHEFRTPVMIAKNAVELSREASEDEREELYTMHAEAIERLTELVDAVLRVASIPDESRASDRTEMDLAEFLGNVIRPALISQDQDAGHRIHHTGEERMDVVLRIDPLHFGVALDALLSNARRFARAPFAWTVVHTYPTSLKWWKEQDHVARIAAYREHLSREQLVAPLFAGGVSAPRGPFPDDDAVVVIEVVDSGIGIPAADLQSIFEPFCQASNSPTRGIRGGGMGLASGRRVIQNTGGTITVRSREGEGSVFALILPARWRMPS